jgi:hypothetical protein
MMATEAILFSIYPDSEVVAVVEAVLVVEVVVVVERLGMLSCWDFLADAVEQPGLIPKSPLILVLLIF